MKKIRPIALAPDKPNAGDPVVVVDIPWAFPPCSPSHRTTCPPLASKKDAIEIASDLAQHDLIRPSSTCGHVSDVVGEKLIYDAPTAQGGGGGPVFNSNGEAIAVNAAYIDGFTGGTIGITTESSKPLLQNAMQKGIRQLASVCLRNLPIQPGSRKCSSSSLRIRAARICERPK